MDERHLWLGWGVAAALTLTASAVDPLDLQGPELLTLSDGHVLATGTDCEPDCREVASQTLVLPDGPGWVLQGEPELVRRGKRARLFVLVTSEEGEQRWFGSRRISEAGGRRRAIVPPEVAGWRAEVGAILVGPDGELVVGPLSLRAARPSVLHQGLWWAAAGAWVLLAAAAGARLVSRVGWGSRLALALVVAGVISGVLLPRGLVDDAILLVPFVDEQDLGVPLSKRLTLPGLAQKGLGHGGGFLLLGLAGMWAGSRPLPVLGRVAGFAAATELLQLLTETRSGSLKDLAIDLTGACIGIALGWKLWKR